MMVECNRTMDQARRDFAAGRLKAAVLLRVPMQHGEWTIRLSGARGDSGMLLGVQDLQPRVFTTLDSAVRAIEQIGFSCTELKIV